MIAEWSADPLASNQAICEVVKLLEPGTPYSKARPESLRHAHVHVTYTKCGTYVTIHANNKRSKVTGHSQRYPVGTPVMFEMTIPAHMRTMVQFFSISFKRRSMNTCQHQIVGNSHPVRGKLRLTCPYTWLPQTQTTLSTRDNKD
jgi:hypothetical protein